MVSRSHAPGHGALAARGTRLFAAATGNYTGTVTAWGLARRGVDGNCTLDQQPLYEMDRFVLSGSLSF